MSGKRFSFDTIKNFDEHIELSIPNYLNLREAILRVSTHFVPDNALVYDLGCSTGLLLERLRKVVPESAKLVGIDKSENLLGQILYPSLTLLNQDLTNPDFALENCDLCFLIFTLQFLPLETRKPLIEKVYNALKPGGALIVAEKQYINDGYIQDVFTFSHYDMKLQHFTAEQILDKQLSLRRIMRSQSEEVNLRLLSPFQNIAPIWQFLQFKAWLCIK